MPGLAAMPDDPESSMGLLRLAQAGDRQALDDLLARYLPRLQRWASGRLPIGIRTMNDTADIVQEAVINALRNFNGIEIRTEGAFLAYLRQSVNNRIIDQFRRHLRHPKRDELPENAPRPATRSTPPSAPRHDTTGGARLCATRIAEIVHRVEFDLD
jgi:RNA polymerase sigma factor (sigma-70 family)